MTLLTPHFSLGEYTHSDTATERGINNVPTPAVIINLVYHAQMMEKIKELFGMYPVLISSGYRSPQLNAAVGGVSNSAHMYGNACDFTIPAFGDVTKICLALQPHMQELGIDQLIDETGGGARWVHVGRAGILERPRYERWTVRGGVTTAGFTIA